MKKRLGLLAVVSVLFYGVLHLSGHLPGLLRGQITWVDERPLAGQLLSVVADVGTAFLFSLAAYLSCYYFYPARRYLWLAGSMLGGLTAVFLLGFCWNTFMEPHPLRLVRYFRLTVLFDILDVTLGVMYFLVRYQQFRELRVKELQLQGRESELLFLRSQINPHFLFNNLNNIYSLVYRGSSDALPAISALSDLLRYMLYQPAETVPLSVEMSYIRRYIDLQQLRFEQPTNIQVTYLAGQPDPTLPTLLLIPFVENAFKHGAPEQDSVWLHLEISVAAGGDLHFQCRNTINKGRKDSTGGIGIENVKKRLALLYPGRHRLDIVESPEAFTVNLVLKHA